MEVDWDMSDDDVYEGVEGIMEDDYEEDTLEQLQEEIERLQEGDDDDSSGNAAQNASIGRFLSSITDLHNQQNRNRAADSTSPASGEDTINIVQTLTIEQFRRLIGLAQTDAPSVQIRLNPEEEEDEDEDEDPFSPPTVDIAELFKKVTEPQADGLGLLMSGEFGRVKHQYRSRSKNKNVSKLLMNRATKVRPAYREDLVSDVLPNSNGTTVATYTSNAYVGQYSSDSSFYYTCVRDFRLHVYDTAAPLIPAEPQPQPVSRICDDREPEDHRTSMKVIKTIAAFPGRWTITDSHLSPDNQRMIYATVSNTVYMATTLDSSPVQVPIRFHDPSTRRAMRDDWYEDNYGIWSCRFSADGNEVIAGGTGNIFVYDLLADRRTVKISAHEDDVNSCCWADTASGNVLVSASDDTYLKVWDRRSLGTSPKPSGVLMGHTEGITYVSAKGDGRYVISNGKDQILRLWDLRKMRSSLDLDNEGHRSYGVPNWDYRTGQYGRPRYKEHPLDCSVMKYTGHQVLRTLIRCHFSPAETTGQQYIYSGSADGRIHIWSLDGQIVEVLDRSDTMPMSNDPSGPEYRTLNSARRRSCIVRDVSWHSEQPILMSTSWLGTGWSSREASVIARHEWKGLSKYRGTGALETYLEKQKLERMERRRQASRGMPGSFLTDDDD